MVELDLKDARLARPAGISNSFGRPGMGEHEPNFVRWLEQGERLAAEVHAEAKRARRALAALRENVQSHGLTRSIKNSTPIFLKIVENDDLPFWREMYDQQDGMSQFARFMPDRRGRKVHKRVVEAFREAYNATVDFYNLLLTIDGQIGKGADRRVSADEFEAWLRDV